MISTDTVAGYLERLASADPTPGGGAVAALHAATGAALTGMVASFTTGARYRHLEEETARIAERSRVVRSIALHAAQEDERLFGQLATAYRMPQADPEAKAARSLLIAQATAAASEPLVATVQAADEVLQLAARLLEIGNRSVISDVAAAAESARAGLAVALVTLEMNIGALEDEQLRERLGITARRAEHAIDEAEWIASQVRRGVAV